MENYKKASFINNTSWNLVGQVVRLIIAFFLNIITSRYLGPANIGVINYVASYLAFFTSLVTLGLNGVIIHELVNHRNEEGKILGSAVVLRFVAGLISVITFVCLMIIVDGDDSTIMLVAAVQAVQLPFMCMDTINFWYQSRMQSKYSVIAQTGAYVFMAIYKSYLLISGKNVIWFAASSSLDVILLSGLYYVFYNKHKVQKLKFSFIYSKKLLLMGLPFILANLMVVVYGQMDKIMIKQLLNSTEEVGLYSAAINICGLIGFIPISILDSGRPMIAEAKSVGQEEYEKRFKQVVAAIIWLCFIYSFGVTILSKPIIYLLYGRDYIGGDLCLKIAVWYTSFSYLGSARSFWLICENKKRFVFIFSAFGAGCNVIMNFLLIPLWGIEGAALATLITQIMANFILPVCFKGTRRYGRLVIEAVCLKEIDAIQMLNLVKNKIKRK